MKTVGLILAFISIVALGYYFSYKTKEEVKQTKEILVFLKYIKTQVELFNMPLIDIYNSFHTHNSNVTSFINSIKFASWEETLENANNLYLSDKSTVLLKEFYLSAESTDRNEVLKKFEYYISLFENEYKEIEAEAPQKAKLYITLSLYAGLLLLIFFL